MKTIFAGQRCNLCQRLAARLSDVVPEGEESPADDRKHGQSGVPHSSGAQPAGHASVRLFSEARLHRNPDGAIQALDVSSAAAAWDAYVDRLGSVELAARVGPPNPAACLPVGRIGVCPLPFYSGPRQLLRRLPRVLGAVRTATSGTSLCLFRLPGTIGLIGATWSMLRRHRYALEVIGDPAGVLRSGVLGPVGRLLAPACAVWMRWVVAGASAGYFVTESTLQSLYPLAPGAPEHSFPLVNLADEDFTAGPRSDRRPVRRLIAVGTHDQLYKGHDDLIRALALLAARGLDLHLGLVGDGRHHDTLRQLARANRVADRVTFHGRVNARGDLRQLLDEADLFCMPSRTEGLPRALIEAMARGVPAVGTTAGGIPELIEPRFCTRPSDPGALAALIATFADGTVDVALASREVWQRAQHFTASQQAERVSRWHDEIARLARRSS